MAPSRKALQELMDICFEYCSKFCLTFNASKSKVMLFGRDNTIAVKPLRLNNTDVEFVSEWKYLGTTIVAGKAFSFTARIEITSFYRAANSILNVLTDAHENVLMSLIYTNCIPIISYACSVKEYPSSETTDCNTAIDSVIRRIFDLRWRQSVRLLRKISGYKSIYIIFAEAKNKFLTQAETHSNPVVRYFASVILSLDAN